MWQIIGHEWAVAYLTRTIDTNRIAHATLFTGPAEIGKTHLALTFAAALHCTGDSERPCGACRACVETMAGAHPDLLLVQPDNGRVKIDQVRQIQHELALKPHSSPWRVCIVTGFETTTTEAANALLKTLEEPPPHAVLLLTALDPGLLLPTIVSRCRVLPLRPVPAQAIAAALVERYATEPDRAHEIAQLSAGRVGWALRACENPSLLEQREADVHTLLELMPKGPAARLAVAEELAKRPDVRPTVFEWQIVWRDVMLLAAGCSHELVINQRHLPALQRLARRIGLEPAREAASRAQQAIGLLAQNVNARLALETMLLSWQHA
jgi:DNA polymerase III subunit delta'